jgi:RNA polymerase sigma factor (TIGR02999 family)
MQQGAEDLTKMLQHWCSGDKSREAELFAHIYPLLRGMAHNQLRANHGMTLQATDIAHDAFMRLLDQEKTDWRTRAQFFAVAATIMRRVVIDYLRERAAIKRGGDVQKLSLDAMTDSETPAAVQSDTDWLRLDFVLTELEQFDASGARLVEMRYFIGMTVAEICTALNVSASTIERQWRFTRAWLHQKLHAAR